MDEKDQVSMLHAGGEPTRYIADKIGSGTEYVRNIINAYDDMGPGVFFGHKQEPYYKVGRDCDSELSIGIIPRYKNLDSEYTYRFPREDNRSFKERLEDAL